MFTCIFIVWSLPARVGCGWFGLSHQCRGALILQTGLPPFRLLKSAGFIPVRPFCDCVLITGKTCLPQVMGRGIRKRSGAYRCGCWAAASCDPIPRRRCIIMWACAGWTIPTGVAIKLHHSHITTPALVHWHNGIYSGLGVHRRNVYF